MNRRQFLKAFGQVLATYAVAGVGIHEYSHRVEPERLAVERVQIPLKNLSPGLEGFRLVQLSDIHIDSFTPPELVREAVSTTNQLQPDVVVLTGDYVQSRAEAIYDLLPMLGGLNARHGVFAILGNHELWAGAELVKEAMRQAGLPLLINRGVTLGSGRDVIYLAGLDDCWAGQPNLAAALSQAPAHAPTVLLAHEPDFADTFCQDSRVSLQLSGHTHGGQVRLPGYGAIALPVYGQKYDQGLFRVDEMWLYTNRGLGLGPVPYRVNCRPEITELTLVRG